MIQSTLIRKYEQLSQGNGICVANIYEYKVIDEDFLCMMLGGKKGGAGEIIVSGEVPNQSYTAEGTFRMVSLTGEQYKKIKFHNLKAQVSADLTLSASEISSFSLVLDIMADDEGKVITIENYTKGQ